MIPRMIPVRVAFTGTSPWPVTTFAICWSFFTLSPICTLPMKMPLAGEWITRSFP